jgi:shikimate kinase
VTADRATADRATVDKVYLVGFMAAGKTSLAAALSRRLGWPVKDIDELIERREHRTVASIFARDGEPYFRQVERQVLLDLVPLRHVIVATGGGTFVDPGNRAIINADGLSVWLDAPLAELLTRIPADGRRPQAADREQMEGLYEGRRAAYAQAPVRLDAARASVDALAEQLFARLDS